MVAKQAVHSYNVRMTSDKNVHRKRCRRWNTPGDAHCLTFSTYCCRPFLRSERTCRWLVEALDAARDRRGFHLWGWVIMPEHVHLVIWVPGPATVQSILRSIKFPMARRAIAWARRESPEGLAALTVCHANGPKSYRFWQRGGGYDRNLRSPRDAHEKIRYIHGNPVRRGLVRRAGDWPWSSWRAYELDVDGPLRLDRDSLPALGAS